MVAYNFQKQFEPLILSGQKCQTIRALGKRRHARPGDAIQLYTGQRTKACRKLLDSQCIATVPIQMKWLIGSQTREFLVTVDGLALTPEQKADFAQADGFKDWDAFFQFFRDRAPFEGVLIKWQPPEAA